MGEIVYAGATSHVGAILRNPDALPERSSELHRAWDEMSATLRSAQPDAVVVVATDHYESFGLEHYPTFCLGVADQYEGWGEFDNPAGRVAGSSELSGSLLASLIREGFDVSRSHELRLDHSFMVPIVKLGLDTAPILPLFVNCNTSPMPTLRRCFDLGAGLRVAAQQLPDGVRIAVLGTGGLSHWVGLPRFGEVNDAWDHEILASLVAGDHDAIFGWSDAEILDTAGNGALEIRTWLVAAGAAGGGSGRVIAYQPMPPWAIGIGVMELMTT